MKEESRMIAKTLQALEPVLAQELERLGATDIEEGRRMVSFVGDKKLLYRANYELRTALRVLLPIAQFRASNPDELYSQLSRLDWTRWMKSGDSFAFDTTVYSESFTHSKYVGYRAKDAVVDFFVGRGEPRPTVRLDHPTLLFHLHISHEEVTLALDSSGDSLHKRGWRGAQTEAPLSEVLAAGILLLAGWEGQSDFLDPMCGSGTLPIEAALIARNIAPGRYRREFAFQRWHDYDPDLFALVAEEARAQERPFLHHIYGSDSSIEAVQIARHNVRLAELGAEVTIQHRAFEDCPQPSDPLLLVTNPPYGERLRLRDQDLYRMIGSRLKHNYPGSKAWIIAYKPEHFEGIGLRPSARYKMLNGSLECELRGYELFAGKREDYKRDERKREEAGDERPRRERPERPNKRGERPEREGRPRKDRREERPRGQREDRERKPFRSDSPRRWDDRPDRERSAREDRPRRERPERPGQSKGHSAHRDDRHDRFADRPERKRPSMPRDRFRGLSDDDSPRSYRRRPSRVQVFSWSDSDED